MAFARKCDICGKLYEFYDEYGINGISKVYIDMNDNRHTKFVLDCCPECLKSIEKHIESLKGDAQ